MTNPVILLGTQSNGETLPVQVDDTGRLVAEGLEGPPGPQGDAFTYEDFTPEQLEGLKGEPGDPGPNVLLPYGPEGSFLTIQNGVPVWTSGETPPEPEPPAHPCMLLDWSDQGSPPGQPASFGLRDDGGSLVSPPGGWDAYARTQDYWDTPVSELCGVSATSSGERSFEYYFGLNFAANTFDHILTLEVSQCVDIKQTSNGTELRTTITPNTEDGTLTGLVPVNDTYLWSSWDPALGLNKSQGQITYLISREALGRVELKVSTRWSSSLDVGVGHPQWSGIQSWKLEPATHYILRKIASLGANS